MTKQNQAGAESAGKAMSRTVEISPLVALDEALALVDFYRNRCLLLANELHALRNQSAVVASEEGSR